MTAQRNKCDAALQNRNESTRPKTGTLLGALLAALLASTAGAQAYAASPQQSMEATTHAYGNPANPLRKESTSAQPRQPKTSPQAHPQRVQAQVSHAPWSGVTRAKPKSPTVYTAQQRSPHAPIGPGPKHAGSGAASSANSHGIIFVGGHSHPLQPGAKQSLNPQPIPPGHVARHRAPAGTPINPSGH